MSIVLIVGPQNRVRNEFAKKLSLQLGWPLRFTEQLQSVTEETGVVVTSLVKQDAGTLLVAPLTPVLDNVRPVLVVLVHSEAHGSDWTIPRFMEEVAVLTLCAASTIPLRALTFDEAQKAIAVRQIAQAVETLGRTKAVLLPSPA